MLGLGLGLGLGLVGRPRTRYIPGIYVCRFLRALDARRGKNTAIVCLVEKTKKF